jgi:membrane associated rhomboid family serine protease
VHDDNPTARKPVITIVIMVLCAVAYFAWQPSPLGSTSADVTFDLQHAAIPLEVRQGHPLTRCQVFDNYGTRVQASQACNGGQAAEPFVRGKQPYLAVLVALFLHGSIVHLGGNMLFLWIFGNNVEDQLGPVGFLALYLVGGVVASLAHIVGNIDSTTPFLGASGAIAVVMGAYIVWFPRARVLTLIPIVLIFWPVRLPAIVVLGLWFVLQFVTQSSSGIATLAHIGGFVFGMLVAHVLARTAGFPRAVGRPRADY